MNLCTRCGAAKVLCVMCWYHSRKELKIICKYENDTYVTWCVCFEQSIGSKTRLDFSKSFQIIKNRITFDMFEMVLS